MNPKCQPNQPLPSTTRCVSLKPRLLLSLLLFLPSFLYLRLIDDDAASPGFAEATYDESGNDAYLDVPIASDQDFAETGYMDVHGGGEASGGYMDVDANDDDDQF